MDNIDHILEKTKQQINKVDAPDYILTRALQQYENEVPEKSTPKMVWAISLMTVVVLIFNVYVISKSFSKESSSAGEAYAESMNLNSSNQLYSYE